MVLLAEFKEKSAFKPIVDFLLTESSSISDLPGDFATEGISSVLASVYDGNPDLILSIVENTKLDEYIRASAMNSIAILYSIGTISKKQTIQIFEDLYYNRLSKDDPLHLSGLFGQLYLQNFILKSLENK